MDDILKILVDAEISKESGDTIEGQLNKIAQNYEGLKVKAILDDKDLKLYEKALKNLSALTGDIDDGTKDVGKKISSSAKEGEVGINKLSKAIDELIKKQEKLKRQEKLDKSGNTTKKVTVGDKFKNTSVTTDNDGFVSKQTTENFKEVNKIYDSMISKSKKWEHATKEQKEEFEKMLGHLKNIQMVSGKDAGKDIQFGSKTFLKQVERVQNEYEKLEGMEKNYQNALKERAKIEAKLGKLKNQGNHLLSDKDYDKINKEIHGDGKKSGLADLKTPKGVEDRLAKINKMYDEIVAKNNELNKVQAEKNRQDSNQKKLDNEAHFFNERLKTLRDGGFIPEEDVKKVEDIFKNISKETNNLNHELKIAKNAMKELEKVAQGKSNQQDGQNSERKRQNMQIASNRHKENAFNMANRDIVPKDQIENFRKMVDGISMKSTKEEIEAVQQEWRRLIALERESAKAKGDNDKATKRVVKGTRDLSTKVKDLEENVEKAFRNDKISPEGYNKVKEAVTSLQSKLREVRVNQDDLSDAQKHAINEEIKALQRQVEKYRDLEQAKNRANFDHGREMTRQNRLGTLVENPRFDASQLTGNVRDDQQRIIRGIQEQLRALHPEIRQFDESMIRVSRNVNSFGQEVYRVDYTLENGERQFRDYSLSIDRTTGNIHDLGQRMRQLRPEMSTMQQFLQAMAKVPIWGMATGIFYGGINQMRMAFEMLVELDGAMTDLRKVADETEAQLRSFRLEASAIGEELGVMAKDVVRATTEFARLGYSLKDSTSLAKASLIYANVGDIEDVVDASTSLIGALKGYAIEEGRIAQEATKYIDIFNEVSNNYAISSAGIGEALKRSSAQLHQAGNTIEEAVGMITAANTAVQDPKKVGTALKTISMRLRGVDDEGKKVANLVPKLEEMFGKVGLTLKKDENTFKSTYEMFNDLSKVWKNLTDMEQAQFVEAIGGKQQGAIVSAMIQNWQDAEDSHNTALNSMGSAQREYEKYMEGFEYKIGRLKNAWEDLWMTLIDDQSLKGAIDALTSLTHSLTKFIDTVGAFAPLSIVASSLFLMMNKTARSVVLLDGRTATLASTFTLLRNNIGKVWDIGKRFIRFAGIIGIATFAVEKLIGVLMKASRERAEYIQDMKDESTEIGNLLTAYEQFDISRYEQLTSKKPSDLNLDERQELLRLQEKMSEVMPNIVQYYNDEGEAILMSVDAMRQYIELQKDRQATLNKDTAVAEIEDFDYDAIRKSMINYQQLMVESANMEDFDKGASIVKKFFENELSQMEIGSDEYFQAIVRMREEIISKLSPDSNFLSQFDSLMNEITYAQDKDALKDYVDAMVLNIEDGKVNVNKGLDDAKNTISSKTTEIKNHLLTLADDLARSSNISKNSNKYLMLQQIVDAYSEGLVDIKANGKDIEKYFLDFQKNALSLLKKIEGNGIDLSKLFKGDKDSMKALEDYANKFSKTSEEGAILSKILDELYIKNEMMVGSMNQGDEVYDVVANMEELAEQYDTAIDKIGEINQLLEEMKEKGELSAESIGILMNKYPELLDYIGDEKALVEKLKKVRKEEEDVALTAIANKNMADNQYLNNVAKANKDFWSWLGTVYQGDLNQFKDLASAKQAVESQLITSLAQKWGMYYDAQTQSMAIAQEQLNSLPEQLRGTALRDMNQANSKLKEIASRFKAISITDSMKNINFNSVGIKDKKDNKKDKKDKKDEPDYQDTIDAWIRMNQLKQESIKLENELVEEQISRAKDQEDYNKQLELTNKLMSGQKKRMNELLATNDRLSGKANAIRKANGKWDTTKWFDSNAEATTSYVNLYNKSSKKTQEEIEKVFTRLQKLKKQHQENRNEYESMADSLYELGQELEDLKFTKAEKELGNLISVTERAVSRIERLLGRIDNAFDYLGENNQMQEIGLYNSKISVLQEQQEVIRKNISQLETLKKSLAGYPELLVEVEDKLQNWRDTLLDVDHEIFQSKEDIKSIYKELADEVVEHYIDQIERERDAKLKAIEDDMKAEEDRHNERMKHLEDEMSLFEKYINQQIEALDKQKDEDDFNKTLSKKQQEAQKVQSQINAYEMDTTLEGKAKKAELEAELAKIMEEITDMKEDRELKLRKDSLKEQLDEKKEHIDDLKKEDKDYSDEQKKQLDKDREHWNKYYENLIADEDRWNKIREDVMSEHIDNITSELQKMVDEVSARSEEMGDNIAKNLIDKLKETQSLLKAIGSDSYLPNWNSDKESSDYINNIINGEGGAKDHTLLNQSDFKLMSAKFVMDKLMPHAKTDAQRKGLYDKGKSWGGSARIEGTILDPNNDLNYDALFSGMSDKEKLLTVKYIREYVMPDIQTPELVEKIKSMTDKVASDVRSRLGDIWGKFNFMEALQKYSIGFDTGGYTGDWGGAGRLAMLHEKELVLNKFDTKNVLDAVSIVREIAKMLPKLSIAPVEPPKSIMGKGDQTINVKFEIDKVMGGEEGARDLMGIFTTGLKKKGVRI